MSAVWARVDTSSDTVGVSTARCSRLTLYWLDLAAVGLEHSVALSALPGSSGRSLSNDLDEIRDAGVTCMVSLCLLSELHPSLAEECSDRGISWFQLGVEEGGVLTSLQLLQLLELVSAELMAGGRVLLHCVSGLGRTCTVAACVAQHADERLSGLEAIAAVQKLCGPRAVQSVAQLNAVLEFRQMRDACLLRLSEPPSRSVSR